MTPEAIDKLAERLKVPAGMLWDALLKQAQVDGWFYGLQSLGIFVLATTLIYGAMKMYREDEDGFGTFLLGALGTISATVSVMLLHDCATCLLNPAGHAAMLLLGK